MRPFFLMLVAILSMPPLVQAQPVKGPGEADPALHLLVAELDARWNARDAESMSRLFTTSVDFRIYGARHHRSREEFRSHYAAAFARIAPDVRHATKLTTVRLLAPGVALLDGEVVVSKVGDPEAEARRFDYSAVAINLDGAWLFDTFRVAPQAKTRN
jgi:uncharacterized protein (TIGR02246 family)